eukprot:TRINITY_DN78_c0_g1_i1.p1 TRINITY_DN78_c0_g1~~TRINITY_DN78_c0_g1_i1.p1  ORF type:complete len:566 (+),score=105.25 TRINITY_DN78_c0_g1_i1:91-1788(+)
MWVRATLLVGVAAVLGEDCQRFTQYNSRREGNMVLEDEPRNMSQAQDCASQCAVTDGCVCFSYNQDNQRCFLMAACKTATTRNSLISGTAGCTVPDPTPDGCRVTPQTATPGTMVLRMRWEHGPGRILYKKADCAGGGALYGIEWKGGVRNNYRIGCRQSATDLYHATCATEELLTKWEDEVQPDLGGSDSEAHNLTVVIPEAPDLDGTYVISGEFHEQPLWRSSDCHGGQCVLFSSGGGFWMLSDSPDGHTRNVGSAKTGIRHNGRLPQSLAWQVMTGGDWVPSTGRIDVEHAPQAKPLMLNRFVGDAQKGDLAVFIPEMPSLIGMYRPDTEGGTPTRRFHSKDCATGGCLLYLTTRGHWMVTGRPEGQATDEGTARALVWGDPGTPEQVGLQWEWRNSRGWRRSSRGAVVSADRVHTLDGSLLDATSITVVVSDIPEAKGTYHAVDRHNGLPLYQCVDCSPGVCSLFAGADGRWAVSCGSGAPRPDQVRLRALNPVQRRSPVAEGEPQPPEAVWEGQPELEPHAVQEWECMSGGAWTPCRECTVSTPYRERKRSAELGESLRF